MNKNIEEKRPNIVYFIADQMRSDSLAIHGNPAANTPNFDHIVENDAVSFENAYCQLPVCVPSRISFISGLYPHTLGHRTMHYLQNEDEPNMMRIMKQQGYEVIWIGRNDIIPANRSKEDYCDEYYDGASFGNKVSKEVDFPANMKQHHGMNSPENLKNPELYSFYVGEVEKDNGFANHDWNCLKSAMDYLERRNESNSEKPFFLYISLIFPHPPYLCEEPWYSLIDRSKLPKRRTNATELKDRSSMLTSICEKQGLTSRSEEWFDELRATYLGMVSRVDHQFGLLLDKLKAFNLYEDTAIFMFGDHGDYTTDYGIAEKAQNCLEDPLVKVPLIVKPPRSLKVKAGVSSALVELLDLSATVSDMAGFQLDHIQFGKSLVDAIGGNPIHKDAVFSEGGRIHGEKQAMEQGHTENSPYWPRLSTQYEEGPQHTKAQMIRMENYKYIYRLYEKDEFYDLNVDPTELNNSIDDSKYTQQISQMKERLLRHLIETGDFVPNRRDKR